MSAFAHSRQSSQESASSASSGASYQLILEHMLSYPGTYELPLRTMYTLNCAPRAQPMPPSHHRSGTPTSGPTSPTSPTFPYDQQAATAQFTSALVSQISRLPSQPCSLPPSFVTSFVNKCFPEELELVDFPQSLTALDYLKDLETRRRKEIANSLRRLGIDESTLGSAAILEELRRWNPSVAGWVQSLEDKERKVENLYTQLYIALRRWILINEMCLEPFHKHNCHAMLNTLYPPVMSTPPTSKLTIPMLKAQHDGFFKYIHTVEKRGKSCLETLMNQGRNRDEPNGWPAVKRTLTQYLTLANSLINECWDVNNTSYNQTRPLPPPISPSNDSTAEDADKRKGRKVDSGISLGQDGRHSKHPSTSSNRSSASQTTRPETPIGKGGSTLERIAREFRKMRPKNKVEVSEIIPQRSEGEIEKENDLYPPVPPPKSKGVSRLRKMKSLGALGDLRHSNSSATSLKSFGANGTPPTFNSREMKKKREAYERRAGGV